MGQTAYDLSGSFQVSAETRILHKFRAIATLKTYEMDILDHLHYIQAHLPILFPLMLMSMKSMVLVGPLAMVPHPKHAVEVLMTVTWISSIAYYSDICLLIPALLRYSIAL